MALLFARDQSEMIKLSKTPVDDHDGGHVFFEGTVRAINKSQAVRHLYYEAYEAVALKQFAQLEEQACERWRLSSIVAVHRLGITLPKEKAVVIKVSAPHRHEAFMAARFLIDELKKNVTIWKQEHYKDGSFSWEPGLCQCADIEDENQALEPVKKAFFYQGLDHEKLDKARVLLIGAGGLGCPLAINLGALGLKHLTVIDGDVVAASNLARQFIFSSYDQNQYKALIIKDFLSKRFTWLNVEAQCRFIDRAWALAMVSDFDVVIESSDCLKTKIMMAEVCKKAQVSYIAASVHVAEGEVAIISPNAQGGCFSCWRIDTDEPESCSARGVLSHACALVSSYACAQAQALLTQTQQARAVTHNQLVLLALDQPYKKIAIKPDPSCCRCQPVVAQKKLRVSLRPTSLL